MTGREPAGSPSRKRGKHRLFIRSEVERWILEED